MATVTIKNIPDDLYERLKRMAVAHRRSVNSEVIVCLERAVVSEGGDATAILSRADDLRTRLALQPVTEEALSKAKDAGRP
ncbi:MAG: Arc family DNA-binding protein [Coriobacteriales bacterium]|nr:Arc family DNA-binding protein [Coriobacteriales bacterium]